MRAERRPWRVARWDLNHSFGQTWLTLREPADTFVDYTTWNRIFARFLAEPAIAAPLEARYGEVLRGVWAAPEVLARLAAFNAEIATSARPDERPYSRYAVIAST